MAPKKTCLSINRYHLLLATTPLVLVVMWMTLTLFALDSNNATVHITTPIDAVRTNYSISPKVVSANLTTKEHTPNTNAKEEKTQILPKNVNVRERFVVFRDGGRGQGLGNITKGIFAAYHMAHDFDRIVCVEWKAFREAFNPPHQDLCNNLHYGTKNTQKVLFWNFGKSMPVDKRRELFASNAKIISFEGNSLRDQPITPAIYETVLLPTARLNATIPWREPPECVVHLRKGDSGSDKRKGLDEGTLQTLEKEKELVGCYLISNNFQWYKRFDMNAGWGHPPWDSVRPHQSSTSTQMELWSDWYTIYRARKVYHTGSRFSESARHASGSISQMILGNAKGSLLLKADF